MDPLTPDEGAHRLQNGQPAPDFSLPDADGRSHQLSDYRGRIVALVFWSAECTWTERADRELVPLLEPWGDEVALLPVASNANEPADVARRTAQERGLPLVLRDAHQEVARLYGARTTPHVFVVDAEGLLRYQGGLTDASFRQPEPTRNYLQEAVEALRAGRHPDPAQTPPFGCSVVYHPLE